MRVVVHESRVLIVASLLLAVGVPRLVAAEPLLLVGQSPVEASFSSATNEGTCQFLVAGQPRNVALNDLVRWSTARANEARPELLLIDGSRLVLADSWTGQPRWQLAGDFLSATTQLLGKITLRRSQVRALVLRAPHGHQQRTRFLDQLLSEKPTAESLRFIHGDQFEGRLVRVRTTAGQQRLEFLAQTAMEPSQVPLERIAAIVFRYTPKPSQSKGSLVVGLSDGSVLIAESLVANSKQLRLRLANGLELNSSNISEVVYLRSLSSRCIYLSDLVESDFQHRPYLDIPWPYRRDRNVLAGPLLAAGRSHAKGLGMLTATRLSYRLDTPEIAGRFQRFVAAVAVDDTAARRGSVIFRVYFEREGAWQLAFTSPVVRGGDSPLPVTVELDDAKQLALVTDFADRGDERDYANWLDARLE